MHLRLAWVGTHACITVSHACGCSDSLFSPASLQDEARKKAREKHEREKAKAKAAAAAATVAAAAPSSSAGAPQNLDQRLRRDTPFLATLRFKNDLPEV